ncbi:MAG TPA: VacB/RNase II family 3'-5' exoribonuclease [Acidobacteriaceae bacterium]|nr:VacB/RNase II family 3'-5' exoribonuclease [Acidobacteriaceae bacterium]
MTDKELLERISRSPGQRAGYKQLVRELGLGGGRERRLLLEQLDRLTGGGSLVKIDRDIWAVPRQGEQASTARKRNNWVSGRLDLHRDGYGFVRPDARENAGEEDIFIPPDSMESAMQGDLVLVEPMPAKRDGRRSGRILRVLERHNPTVVGIFHYANGKRTARGDRMSGNFVTPLNARISEAILVPFGAEIPEHAATLDRVLGAEAAELHERYEDLEGLVVDVAITDWPTGTRPARGRVIEVLGDRDAFGVDVEILIRKHYLPHIFPDRVLQEAREVAVPPASDPKAQEQVGRGRRDFRDLPIVTIDGETAKDFDDAVLVRQLADGGYELQVHIADVAHYVRPGMGLDLEARLRGNSVYFPDRAIPMLPMELSTDVCSLRPHEERLVLSCVMQLGPDGEVLSSEVSEGVIRSARRMTYTQVHDILQGDAEARREFAPLVPEFERMLELAQKMNARREQRGSIDFDLPEPVIEFDEQGRMRGIVRSDRTWANRLIEEFMLAANECVASWIESLGVPSIYRIHEKPDAKRVANFEEIAAHFGYSLGVGALPIKRVELRGDRRDRRRSGGSDKRMREIPEDILVTPQMYQKLTERLAGKPEERILTYLMLRSLKQARYSEKNEGHFALATPSYTHFTSPIRRYADLIVHRITKALLAAGIDGRRQLQRSEAPSAQRRSPGHRHEQPAVQAPVDEQELAAIAQEVSQCERRAADAERELIEWKKIRFMQDKIGEEFSGIILNVTKYGLFVELDDLFVEGLVPLATLQGDRFRFNENSRQLLGGSSNRRISVGDEVRVILDRIDAVENKLQFALVEQVSTGAAKKLSDRKSTGQPSAHPTKKRQMKKSRAKSRKRR